MKILYVYTQRLSQLGSPEWYFKLGIKVDFFDSTRQLNQAIKKKSPDYLMADFVYGYGNNYAGANVSNLDVSLRALERYSPQCKIIILVIKEELEYINKLKELFNIDAILPVPFSKNQLKQQLIN